MFNSSSLWRVHYRWHAWVFLPFSWYLIQAGFRFFLLFQSAVGTKEIRNKSHWKVHRIRHFRNAKGTKAKMCSPIVSGMVKGDAPVSYWSFFPVPSNNPRSLYESLLGQVSFSCFKWRTEHHELIAQGKCQARENACDQVANNTGPLIGWEPKVSANRKALTSASCYPTHQPKQLLFCTKGESHTQFHWKHICFWFHQVIWCTQ